MFLLHPVKPLLAVVVYLCTAHVRTRLLFPLCRWGRGWHENKCLYCICHTCPATQSPVGGWVLGGPCLQECIETQTDSLPPVCSCSPAVAHAVFVHFYSHGASCKVQKKGLILMKRLVAGVNRILAMECSMVSPDTIATLLNYFTNPSSKSTGFSAMGLISGQIWHQYSLLCFTIRGTRARVIDTYKNI